MNPRELSERALHEYVAEVEGHHSQVTGIVSETSAAGPLETAPFFFPAGSSSSIMPTRS